MLNSSKDAQGISRSSWVFSAANNVPFDTADAPRTSSAAELLAEAVQRFGIAHVPAASSTATSTPLQSRSTTSAPLTELSELHTLFETGGTPLDVEGLGIGRTLIRPLAQVSRPASQSKPASLPVSQPSAPEFV